MVTWGAFLTTSRALSAPRSASASGWKSPKIASTSSPKRPATSNGSTSTRNALHANPPGGITIAHGLLSLSLIPVLIRDIIGLKVVKNTLNYGANKVRYLTPVPAGSRLRGRLEVIRAEDVPPNALRVTYKVTIEIEGGKRPACVAEVIGQHYR